MKHLIGLTKVLVALSFILLIYNLIVWIVASQVLYKDIDNLVNDAMELTIEDESRTDHISQLDPDAFWDNFAWLVTKHYNLDGDFRPIEPGLIEQQLVITDLDIEPGKYTYDPDTEVLQITETPQVHITGYTTKHAEVMFWSGDVQIPFDVIVTNQRVD